MNKSILRIGIAFWPGAIEQCVVDRSSFKYSPDCAWLGNDAQILSYLLKLTRIPYELVPYGQHGASYEWGILDQNHIWTGILGDLQSGVIDMCAASFTATKQRNKYFDFTFPISYDNLAILKPVEVATVWQEALIIVNVYSWQVWSVFAAFILVISAIFAYLHMQHDIDKIRKLKTVSN
jgi:hypothetical protein